MKSRFVHSTCIVRVVRGFLQRKLNTLSGNIRQEIRLFCICNSETLDKVVGWLFNSKYNIGSKTHRFVRMHLTVAIPKQTSIKTLQGKFNSIVN